MTIDGYVSYVSETTKTGLDTFKPDHVELGDEVEFDYKLFLSGSGNLKSLELIFNASGFEVCTLHIWCSSITDEV